MTTLDNPTKGVDESTVPFLPTALRYGGIAGLILVAYTAVSNLAGLNPPASMVLGLVLGLVAIVATVFIGILPIRFHRDKELGGYISFGRAFLVGLVAMVVAGIISTLFNYLWVTVIDPGFADTAAENVLSMMEGMGVPEDQLDAQVEAMKANYTGSAMLKNGLLWGPAISAIVALIIAAVMKKKEPVV